MVRVFTSQSDLTSRMEEWRVGREKIIKERIVLVNLVVEGKLWEGVCIEKIVKRFGLFNVFLEK